MSCRARWLSWLAGEPIKRRAARQADTAPDDAPACHPPVKAIREAAERGSGRGAWSTQQKRSLADPIQKSLDGLEGRPLRLLTSHNKFPDETAAAIAAF